MSDVGPQRILGVLKAAEGLAAGEIAEQLGITSVGARQHLNRLLARGLVAFVEHRQLVGRPRRIWRLSAAGHASFDDRHRDLASELLAAIVTSTGTEGLAGILAIREAQQLQRYRGSIGDCRDLAGRVRRLTELRCVDGYMAECRETPDEAWLLTENHCPIAQAVKACSGICGAELRLFQEVMGREFSVVRTQHMPGGDRCCTYRIEPARQATRQADAAE